MIHQHVLNFQTFDSGSEVNSFLLVGHLYHHLFKKLHTAVNKNIEETSGTGTEVFSCHLESSTVPEIASFLFFQLLTIGNLTSNLKNQNYGQN